MTKCRGARVSMREGPTLPRSGSYNRGLDAEEGTKRGGKPRGRPGHPRLAAPFAGASGAVRILWLGTKRPWPPADGGRLLSFDTIRLLSRRHRITLVVPETGAADDLSLIHISE